MGYSVNELAVLTRLAAKGAGNTWGMAEEASFAVRWLVSRQLAGVEAMASVLRLHDSDRSSVYRPKIENARWVLSNTALCPLYAGVALNDYADVLVNEDELMLGDMAFPLIVLPFASQLSQALNLVVQVSWDNARAVCASGGLYIDRATNTAPDATGWQLSSGRSVSCTFVKSINDVKPMLNKLHRIETSSQRPAIDSTSVMLLKALAHRTYAPASEASRALGAGAGTSDND